MMRIQKRKSFLYFSVFLQADYFQETVLRIEGDNVSAVDVAHHLDALRGNLLLRKVEKYLHPTTEAEMETMNGEYDREMVEDIFAQFFGNF